MLTTAAKMGVQIPVRHTPERVRPIMTHLATLTNQMTLAALLFYGRHGELRTLLAWECRCEERFVHPASQEVCLTCNTHREAAANATIRDALAACPDDMPDLIRIVIEAAAIQFDPSLVEPPF